MAKSLRSKWKRKMRAVKRERYGEKELKRLNEMLEKAGDYQLCPEVKEEPTEGDAGAGEVVVVEQMVVDDDSQPKPTSSKSKISKITGSGRKSRSDDRNIRTPKNSSKADEPEKMNVDGERIFNKRTMRDQYGNYPDWMNKRKMRTQQKKNKRLKKRAMSVKKR